MANVHFDYNFKKTDDHKLQQQFHQFLLGLYPDFSTALSSWHDQICAELSQSVYRWWFSQGSRLIAWQPAIYQPLYYAHAIMRFKSEHKIETLTISGAPKVLKEYLQEIDPSGSYLFTDFINSKNSFISDLKSLFAPYWELTKLFRDAVFNSEPLRVHFRYSFGIYSQFWGFKRYAQSGDHFFGNMFAIRPKDKSVLWIYNPSAKISKNDKDQMKKSLRESGDVIFMEDYWTLKDAFGILKDLVRYKITARSRTKDISPLIINGIASKSFTTTFIKEMINAYYPITELKTERFFNKLKKVTRLDKIIFPFEDKGLERAIISTLEPQTMTYGYAHAVHNPGHLYMTKKYNGPGFPPRPSYIIFTGKASSDWFLKKSKTPSDKVLIGGSNRFVESQEYPLVKNKNALRVLVLIGQAYEVSMLANWVDENPQIFNDCVITLRKYPFADQEEQNAGIERLRKHTQVIDENRSLVQQIHDNDVVIFCSTSAGLEGILAGKIGIYANLHHIVPINPLEEKGASESIIKCENAHDLHKAIKLIKNFSVEELRQKSLEQIAFAQTIYQKPNLHFLWTGQSSFKE